MQIGIGHALLQFRNNHFENLKQYAMIFDEIHIVNLKSLKMTTKTLLEEHNLSYIYEGMNLEEIGLSEDQLHDLSYLQESGFVREATLTSERFKILEMTDEEVNNWELIGGNSDLKNAIIELNNKTKLALGKQKSVSNMTISELDLLLEDGVDFLKKWETYESRIHALILRNRFGTNAVSMEHFWERDSRSIDRKATETDLYEIIINGWPMPADITPWDDIFAFRSEAASQQQLRALRLWVADMAKGKLTIAEASDKIEYLKQEYRSHMKGANIKMGTSVVRTVVVGMAELIENAVKLKLKELAEAPFKLFDAKATLVDAERKAPGRELAYVVRAENKLSGI